MKHSFGRPPDGVGIGKKEKATGNKAIIEAAMKDRKVRGNPKDYVLLVRDRLIDCSGSYKMFQVNEDQTEHKKVEFDKVRLVHKRNLHQYAAEPVASRFWNRKLGVRVPQRKRKD